MLGVSRLTVFSIFDPETFWGNRMSDFSYIPLLLLSVSHYWVDLIVSVSVVPGNSGRSGSDGKVFS